MKVRAEINKTEPKKPYKESTTWEVGSL
jgi:hypothetical protein